MNISMLLRMVVDAHPSRVLVDGPSGRLQAADLWANACRLASHLTEAGVGRVVYVAETAPELPVCLFAAALADVPFVPLNYRLADDRLRALATPLAGGALLVGDEGTLDRIGGIEGLAGRVDIATVVPMDGPTDWSVPDTAAASVAVVLHTSGTSGPPKPVELRHANLTGYVLGVSDLLSADVDESALVSVPPYHVAGIAAILTSAYTGRRVFQLARFDPRAWVDTVRRERVTHAMQVPTMVARVLEELDPASGGDGAGLPSLRHLSYGGGRMPLPVIQRAMALLPQVDFVNAYGLTETSSTVSVLTPEDHRIAQASEDPAVRRRLSSVGRPLSTVMVEVRDEQGQKLPAGVPGEIWIAGQQVVTDRAGKRGAADGWHATRDRGLLDEDGYLFVLGRLDDVIVRGGENLAPGEIEDVLLEHPAVSAAAVVGVPDDEWGEVPAAVVVAPPSVTAGELANHVEARLRSARRPALVVFRESLPTTDNGKVLRRQLRDELIRAQRERTINS